LFHNQGGNLKTVQQLLDKHIDATVKKIGATFIPNDKGAPETQEVTKYLKQHFHETLTQEVATGGRCPENITHPITHYY
jgi:hypothetical protein